MGPEAHSLMKTVEISVTEEMTREEREEEGDDHHLI